jgi:zinc transport system substrate-binding protein
MFNTYGSQVRWWPLALSTAVVLAVAGCAFGSTVAGGGPARGGHEMRLVSSFYPLQWTAQQIAGKHAMVGSLTKPGAEPHDLELTPRDVARVADADLVIYAHGFQPAVDDAVRTAGAAHAFDVAGVARLDLTYTPIEAGQRHSDEAGATDPHFWLDPTRLAAVGDALGARLAHLDPVNAATYRRNAAALHATLSRLDADYRAGLAHCANPDLVTSHNAFGYLAQRYHLNQIGITGLTPDAEPNPGDLAQVAAFVRAHHVRTIYYETLVSPDIATTVASATGARTAILDPIEGLSSRSQGRNYLAIMRANLANLRAGQPCQ